MNPTYLADNFRTHDEAIRNARRMAAWNGVKYRVFKTRDSVLPWRAHPARWGTGKPYAASS